jgi:hypothetical protein
MMLHHKHSKEEFVTAASLQGHPTVSNPAAAAYLVKIFMPDNPAVNVTLRSKEAVVQLSKHRNHVGYLGCRT